MYCLDQHDKWKYKAGLALHICVEPFTGVIKWPKVWRNNSNPRLICGYFLDVVERDGCKYLVPKVNTQVTDHFVVVPLITQSDPGIENGHVAKAQCFIRQSLDPALEGTIQHRYMRNKKNIPPELQWSQFRRRFSPGFEDIIDWGIAEGIYDPKNYLQRRAAWLSDTSCSPENADRNQGCISLGLCSMDADRGRRLCGTCEQHPEAPQQTQGHTARGPQPHLLQPRQI